jgi:hypothetical protein
MRRNHPRMRFIRLACVLGVFSLAGVACGGGGGLQTGDQCYTGILKIGDCAAGLVCTLCAGIDPPGFCTLPGGSPAGCGPPVADLAMTLPLDAAAPDARLGD